MNNKHSTIAHADVPPASSVTRRERSLAIVSIALFLVSTMFPIVASLVDAPSFPGWVGYGDVGLAFVLLVLSMIVTFKIKHIDGHAMRASYRIYRMAANLPLVLIAIFFTWGDRIDWSVLLVGLAWRTWLALYTVPYAVALLQAKLCNTRSVFALDG